MPKVESAHVAEVQAFVDAIINNKPSPVPGENGLILNAIFDAIYRSSETGREEQVDVSFLIKDAGGRGRWVNPSPARQSVD